MDTASFGHSNFSEGLSSCLFYGKETETQKYFGTHWLRTTQPTPESGYVHLGPCKEEGIIPQIIQSGILVKVYFVPGTF